MPPSSDLLLQACTTLHLIPPTLIPPTLIPPDSLSSTGGLRNTGTCTPTPALGQDLSRITTFSLGLLLSIVQLKERLNMYLRCARDGDQVSISGSALAD